MPCLFLIFLLLDLFRISCLDIRIYGAILRPSSLYLYFVSRMARVYGFSCKNTLFFLLCLKRLIMLEFA
jgi:hypothetical protein